MFDTNIVTEKLKDVANKVETLFGNNAYPQLRCPAELEILIHEIRDICDQ